MGHNKHVAKDTVGTPNYRTDKIVLIIPGIYVTQSRETVPNCTLGKIKLTSPAYSHTTVLLVSSLNFGVLTQG